MAELKATVCLQGKDIEVISSHIEFNRKTDNKGRPVTNVIGGRITITVESTRETTISCQHCKSLYNTRYTHI